MKRVHKYPIVRGPNGRYLIEVEDKAEFLSFQVQNGVPCVWMLVDLRIEKVKREFFLVGTGIDVPLDTEGDAPYYLGTVQQGEFVWHLFEPFEDQKYPGVGGKV